jgi:hypothetical protein
MNEHFNSFLDNITGEDFDIPLHTDSIEKFEYSLKQSITICEKNSDKIGQGGAEDEYWFMVLEELYCLNRKLKEQNRNDRDPKYKEFEEELSRFIRELLFKMSSYVSIQAILGVRLYS